MDEDVARALIDDSIELMNRISHATGVMRERLAPASKEEQRPYVHQLARAAGAIGDLINRISKVHPGLEPTEEDYKRVAAERLPPE